MKTLWVLLWLFIGILLVSSCSAPVTQPTQSPTQTTAPSSAPSPTPSPTPDPTPSPTPEPTETPTPEPTVFGETPDHAGAGNVTFDIYQRTALVDLDGNGQPEEVTFTAGDASSTLQINGTEFTIDKAGLAQLFAVTDVDTSDNILELAFTDRYSELADSEKAYTWLYWWDGTQVVRMGGLMDVKFDGAWREGFDPAEYFDAQGTVMCLARSTEFTDIWYTGHYVCSGSERKLKEDNYVTKPVNKPGALTLLNCCVLLKKINSDYFEPEYYVIWDYASGSSLMDRDYADDVISFIPQAGEELKIVRVYGKKWFKLKAQDGKTGWLKCIDGKIQGYEQVMHYTASDIFDGILNAG